MSKGHQLYYDPVWKICLCVKCAELGQTMQSVLKWYGYYEQGRKKYPMDFVLFYQSQVIFFGFGSDTVGKYVLKGTLDKNIKQV